jgi:pimeloyl-ACP methyl ester carboxylesterase
MLALAVAAIALLGPLGTLAATPKPCDARCVIGSVEAVVPGGIDEQRAVKIGGMEQWISVRGNDPGNPILLFLHGGPGSPMMGESWTFQRPWEDFFTVVQWDQRGSGRTFSLAGRKVDRSMTIDRMEADADDLIEYLRRTYGKRKIFLLGHSWGSILGLRIAEHHPEWLYAYIGVGQVVNMRKNEAAGYQLTLARARALHDLKAVKSLEALAPYPNDDGSVPWRKTMREREWDVALGGMLYGHSSDDEEQRWSLSPAYRKQDVISAGLGEESTVGVLWSQLAAVNFDGVTRLGCPLVIFAGAEDFTTPASLAESLYDRIQAPQKRLFVIQGAAHYVFMERPGEFLMDLVRYVRPLAGRGRRPAGG